MDGKGRNLKNKNMNGDNTEDDEMDLRRGPWTVEEDFKLINYIATHGEGRWNSLARCAGLKRTGKSCRLRWLNYLRPDVRRGNITLEEQLLILELHSRWGNRWSKIAQYLPGRTDNEIKNYWRTRVQKHAKQLKCDVNSKQFKDTMRYLWMPRLVERIQAAAAANSSSATTTAAAASSSSVTTFSDQLMVCNKDNNNNKNDVVHYGGRVMNNTENPNCYTTPENSNVSVSPASDLTEYYSVPINDPNPNPNPDYYYQGGLMGQTGGNNYYYSENNNTNLVVPAENYYFNYNGLIDEDLQAMQEQSNLWFETGGSSSDDSLWNMDFDQDFWFLQQLNNGSF